MKLETTTPDRSWVRLLIVAGLWVVSYFVARVLLDQDLFMRPGTTWLRVVIALLPVPTFALLLFTLFRNIRRMDELQLRIQLEALAIAYPLAMLLLMTLGLLELAVRLSPADWSYRHVWPFMAVFYFGGVALATRRYQ